MKVAVIGSRGLKVNNLEKYLPPETSEIVSGGARGIDKCAAAYAKANNIKLTEFFPDYANFGRQAPLRRNITIINYADMVIAFWDGNSRGTKFVIENCKKMKKKIKVFCKRSVTGREPDTLYIFDKNTPKHYNI